MSRPAQEMAYVGVIVDTFSLQIVGLVAADLKTETVSTLRRSPPPPLVATG